MHGRRFLVAISLGAAATACSGGDADPPSAVDVWFEDIATAAPAETPWLSGIDLEAFDVAEAERHGLYLDGNSAAQAASFVSGGAGSLGTTPDRSIFLAVDSGELSEILLPDRYEAALGSTLVNAASAQARDLIVESFERGTTFDTNPGVPAAVDALAEHPVWYWAIGAAVHAPEWATEEELDAWGVPPLLLAYNTVGVGLVSTEVDHRMIIVYEHDDPDAAAENRDRIEAQLAAADFQTGVPFDDLYVTERIELDGTRVEVELVVLVDLTFEPMLFVRPSNLFMTAGG